MGLSLIVLPSMGSYGFWEPQEMQIAARALPASEAELAEELERSKKEEARIERDKQLAEKKGVEYKPRAQAVPAKKKYQAPPMQGWLVKKGISIFGVSEFGARSLFFLLALFTALATFALGNRLRGPKAGLISAIVLIACPLFLFQSRQLNSEMGAMAGGVFLLLGSVGLASPLPGRPLWKSALDAVLLFAGAAFGYYSAGFLIGVLAPLGAIALALVVSTFSDTAADPLDSSSQSLASKTHLKIAAVLASLGFLALAGYFVFGVFDWVEAGENEFSIFGKTFHASPEYQNLIAGKWRTEGDLKVNFNSLFQQLALGLFPWIGLAPIAIAKMAQGGDKGSNPLGARMLFAWAAVSWVACTIAMRKIGPVQFAAVPAIAVAIGIWLDELHAARKEREAQGLPPTTNLAPPLIALFVCFAILVIARDIKSFPELFLSVHLDKGIAKFPTGISLHKVIMALGMLFAILLAGGIYGWHWQGKSLSFAAGTGPLPDDSRLTWALERFRRIGHFVSTAASFALRFLGRWGFSAALSMGIVLSIFLTQVWTPRMSTKLSSKATFSVYHALRKEGNELGVLGKATPGASFYSHGSFESLRGRGQLLQFLKRPKRVFALVPASELCPIHKEAAKGDFRYYVVDDSNADKVMLSNRMWNGDAVPPQKLDGLMRSFLDQNPLARDIVRTPPQGIVRPLSINFDDKLEIIGVDMPRTMKRGSTFEARIYYRVLKPIRRNWQVFVHFDGGGVRFQADHYPVNKRCGTNYWQPGDYIIDRFTVDPGNVAKSGTNYTVWTGLFVGRAGNWENMKAKSGNPDSNNRVSIGTIRVD